MLRRHDQNICKTSSFANGRRSETEKQTVLHRTSANVSQIFANVPNTLGIAMEKCVLEIEYMRLTTISIESNLEFSSSGTYCLLDLAPEVRRTATQSTDASSSYWYRPYGPAGTIEAASGYSIGPVLRMRITLPDQGVANVQKKGRSSPFSLYSSMTCLLVSGPWRISIRAFIGMPPDVRSTSTASTAGSIGDVFSAPPWMYWPTVSCSGDGICTRSCSTCALIGNSIWPMLRTATVLGPRGVSNTTLMGRTSPSSEYTRAWNGVLPAAFQTSTVASSGRPTVLRSTFTFSTAGSLNAHVRSVSPWICTLRAAPGPGADPRP